MPASSNKLKVIIVGAGVGGLLLAYMLELAGIDYQVLERSRKEFNRQGGVIQFTAVGLRLFDQLGLLPFLYPLFKPISSVSLYRGDLTPVGKIDASSSHER
jgi:2-polyprenyl-6-methoxyphenol hydroxylase-like FAD-dependent oxidoreductase